VSLAEASTASSAAPTASVRVKPRFCNKAWISSFLKLEMSTGSPSSLNVMTGGLPGMNLTKRSG